MKPLFILAVGVLVLLATGICPGDARASDYYYLGDLCWSWEGTNGYGLRLGMKAGLFYMGGTHLTLAGMCNVGDPGSDNLGPCTGHLELVGTKLVGTILVTPLYLGKLQGEWTIELATLEGDFNAILYVSSSPQPMFSTGVVKTATCASLML